MKSRLFLISLIFTGLSIQTVNAQCVYNTSTQEYEALDGGPCNNTIITAIPFLRITPDARIGGMGDAGVATSADAGAMYINAAKLANVEDDFSVAATYSPWLRDIGLTDVYLAYLTGYKKLSDVEAIGASLKYFSLGSINYTDANGMPLGTGRPNEFEVALAYSRKLSENFSASLTGKYIYSNLAKGYSVGTVEINAANAGAVDLGVLYSAPIELGRGSTTLSIGAAITNVGSKVTYTASPVKDFIPANLGIGAALDMDIDDYNRITFAFDINKLLVPSPQHADQNPEYDLNGNGIAEYREKSLFSGILGSFSDAPNSGEEFSELMYSIGAEYWYDKQIALRAGYYYEAPTKGNRQYLTAGFGFKYNVLGMNVSYLVATSNQKNPLDNTLRLSLLFDMEAFSRDNL